MTCVLGSDRFSQRLKRRHHRHLHLGLINGIASINIGKLELQFHLERVAGRVFCCNFWLVFWQTKLKTLTEIFRLFAAHSINHRSG